jgi:hypothetical protein
MTTTQQYFAAGILAVLVLGLLGSMAIPARRFGFGLFTVGRATVVGLFALAATVWFVYAQRYHHTTE